MQIYKFNDGEYRNNNDNEFFEKIINIHSEAYQNKATMIIKNVKQKNNNGEDNTMNENFNNMRKFNEITNESKYAYIETIKNIQNRNDNNENFKFN